jgi:hypothetical protein
MKKWLAIGLGILTLSAMTIQSASAYTVVPIKTTSADEGYGHSLTFNGHTYFSWTQFKSSQSSTGAVLVTKDGGQPTRVNDPKTLAFSSGIDPTSGTLIYQQAPNHSDNSNLYTYDLATGTRHSISGANSSYWDCCADAQGSLLLYGQNQFVSKTSPWKVFLYNVDTHAKTQLDQANYACRCLSAGNIDGNFVTWSKGASVIIFDLTLGTKIGKITPPHGREAYNPFIVDPDTNITGDETVFWSRSANGCGHNVSIYEAPLAHLGNVTTLYSLPQGKDIFSITVDNSAGERDLYFSRFSCGATAGANIYEIPNV